MVRAKPYPLPALGVAALSLAMASCLGGVSGSDEKNRKSAKIQLIAKTQATKPAAAARRAASNGAAELESFQVAVEGVWLARDIQINGSAWNSPAAMLSLYENQDLQDGGHHNVVNPSNAADPSVARHFIDFMSPAGVSRLSTSAPFYSQQVGDYNFVVVNWAMPLKIKASIDVGGGVTVRTKAGTVDTTAGDGDWFTRAPSSLLSGDAEEAVVVKRNGGTWFRFLRPLSIRDSDLDQVELVRDTSRRDSNGNVIDTLIPKGQLSVLLVFNPEAYLAAWDSGATGGDNQQGDIRGPGVNDGHIRVPYLDATAVPYRVGEEVWRETYVFEGTDASRPGMTFRSRLELYVIEGNVVAATVRGLVGPGGELPMESHKIFFADSGDGGVLSLKNHERGDVVAGFRQLASVGATGTADLVLGHLTLAGASYRLTEKRRVN